MAKSADGSSGDRLRRLRWRLSGAWLWPAFIVVTLVEMAMLHWLPIAGEGSRWIAAVLLAGSLNVVAIAILGGLGGLVLRRRRPDLPRVVADDFAGLAALAVVGLALLVAGLVHRPELAAEREAFKRQSLAVRLWVDANANDFARAHVDGADTVQVDRDLYRTCVPQLDPKRWLCLVVDTSHDPPRVKRDTSRESNASQNPRGVFR